MVLVVVVLDFSSQFRYTSGDSVEGHWFIVISQSSLVNGHWSLVISHWSLVTGYWLLVTSSFRSSCPDRSDVSVEQAQKEAKLPFQTFKGVVINKTSSRQLKAWS